MANHVESATQTQFRDQQHGFTIKEKYMHQIFTLSSVSGDYLSGHPEGGHVAYLYHSHELADDAMREMEKPDEWEIKEIADLPEWLEKCKLEGITHIYECKAAGMINMHQLPNFLMFANSSGGKKSLE